MQIYLTCVFCDRILCSSVKGLENVWFAKKHLKQKQIRFDDYLKCYFSKRFSQSSCLWFSLVRLYINTLDWDEAYQKTTFDMYYEADTF